VAMLHCGFDRIQIVLLSSERLAGETVMAAEHPKRDSLVALAVCAAVSMLAGTAHGSTDGTAYGDMQNPPAAHLSSVTQHRLLLLFAQNAFAPFTVQQQPEAAVSPINPGTLPGSTAAIGGSATGTNPITGLPCNGLGSISVSGAGGLPGTATPPPGVSTETLDQIPVGTPPVTSIYGSQSNLGSC
jgi:hypothetical protein